MSSDKDWMFCPTSGYLLHLDPKRQVAACPVSGYERSLAGKRGGLIFGVERTTGLSGPGYAGTTELRGPAIIPTPACAGPVTLDTCLSPKPSPTLGLSVIFRRVIIRESGSTHGHGGLPAPFCA